MMNKLRKLKSVAGLFSFLCKSLMVFVLINGLGSPWSYAELSNRLRAGMFRKSHHEKWVIIGTKVTPWQQSPSYNLWNLGFEGEDLDQVNPKYLIKIRRGKVRTVQAFESDQFSKNEKFLNVRNIHNSLTEKIACDVSACTGKVLGFPISTITLMADLPRKSEETTNRFHAYYLLEIINQALPPHNHFPQLKTALSRSSKRADRILRTMGEAILIRYNPKNNIAGATIEKSGGSFYEKWRQLEVAKRIENKAYTTRMSNERNLPLATVDESFGIVFLRNDKNLKVEDIEEQMSRLRFVGVGLDPKESQRIYNAIHEQGYPEGTLIPWYLVSFINPKGPVDLTNFISPGTFYRNLKSLVKKQFGSQVGGSLLPLSHLLAKAFRKQNENRHLFQGKTMFLSRTEAYGSVLALAETKIYDFLFSGLPLSNQKIAHTPLWLSLWDLGIDAKKLPGIYQTDISDTLNDVSTLMLRVQRSAEYLTNEPNEHKETLREEENLLYLESQMTSLGALSKKELPSGRSLASVTETEKTVRKKTHRKKQIKRIKKVQKRTPSVVPVSRTPGEREPMILLLIDGLRPDRFKEAMDAGIMPQLSKIFRRKSIEIDTFSSRSLTLPSWATILTGFEPDVHGIRSNTPASRLEGKIVDNFADARKDFLNAKYWTKNRAFRRLEDANVGEKGKIWFPAYYDPKEVFLNYLPIVNGPHSALYRMLKDYFKNFSEYKNEIRYHASALDSASARMTADAIREDAKHKAELKLIMNWYASVDEASHYNNTLLPRIYAELDEEIGNLLDAAREHPTLKNARVFVISDHGHTGGYGPFTRYSSIKKGDTDIHSPLYKDPAPMLANTGFNITKFLAGEFYNYSHYNFNIGVATPPDPKFDLSMQNFLLSPYKFVYPFLRKKPNALVDSSGDNIAQIYFQKDKQWTRLTYNELKELKIDEGQEQPFSILKDLLSIQLPNLMIQDPHLAKRIYDLSQNRPVGALAIGLHGVATRITANEIGATAETLPSNREPVLVLAKGAHDDHPKMGLILTRTDSDGHDYYRYVVLKSFTQDKSGRVQGEVSLLAEDDPIGYLGEVEGAHRFDLWRTDREWLSQAKDHRWPTAIFSLSRLLALSERFTDPNLNEMPEDVRQSRMAETPDLVLIANPGFSFHNGEPMEGDHGGLLQEEVRSSFFVSHLGNSRKSQLHLKSTMFTRDIAPTLMEFAGMGAPGNDPLPKTQGQSYKSFIEQFERIYP